MSTTTIRTSSICPWAGCGERNRPEAVFCAQCGRVLDPVDPHLAGGFVRGASVRRPADHLGEMLGWGMAAAGIMILIVTFLSAIRRIAG